MAFLTNFIWVTFVNSLEYLNGAKVLAKSLEISNSKYKLLILIPEDFIFSENIIQSNIEYKKITQLKVTCELSLRDDYKYCINKLYAWTLISYEKVCWLDSDMIVLHNIDDIFTYNINDDQIGSTYGCKCNILNNIKLPTLPNKCPFNNINYKYFNAGLILLKPSINIYNKLLLENYNYPFVEQDVFNIIFKNNIYNIDSKYNYINNLEFSHPTYKPDIHIFHFAYCKPWNTDRLSTTFEHIYNLWFEYKALC